jgi:hypothetical protein
MTKKYPFSFRVRPSMTHTRVPAAGITHDLVRSAVGRPADPVQVHQGATRVPRLDALQRCPDAHTFMDR